jgi:predicted acylesterase/phospholipase RssA
MTTIITMKEEEKEDSKKDSKEDSKIQSIVLSGGGPVGFSMYGALKESNKSGFWDLKNIETIYGTSVGAILGVIISLNYDWEILDDYLINRPWQQIFKFDMSNLINAIHQKGIYDINIMKDIFTPLFNGKDIPLDITMADYYEKTKIEFHFYTTEINNLETEYIDISHHTHPEWKLLDAVYASCCLPILFLPLQIGDEYYIDGGLYNNYPIQNSLDKHLIDESIFGITTEFNLSNKIDEKSNLFDYMVFIIHKILLKKVLNNKMPKIKNEIKISNSRNILLDIFNTASSKEERLNLINMGVKKWGEFKNL